MNLRFAGPRKPIISDPYLAALLRLLAFVFFLAPQGAYCQEAPLAMDYQGSGGDQAGRREMLREQRDAIEATREDLRIRDAEMGRRLLALREEPVTDTMLYQARVDADSARLRLQDLDLGIANAKRDIKELQTVIRDLEARELLLRNPAKDEIEGLSRVKELGRTRALIAERKVDLELAEELLANLDAIVELANRRLQLAERWRAGVEELYRVSQEEMRREAQKDLVQRLQQEQQRYMDQTAEYSEQLERDGASLSDSERRLIGAKLRSAEQWVKLIRIDMRLAAVQGDLNRLEELASRRDVDARDLDAGLRRLADVRSELENADELLRSMTDLLHQQKLLTEQRESPSAGDRRLTREEFQVLTELVDGIAARREDIGERLAVATAIRTLLVGNLETRVKEELFLRMEFPKSVDEWRELWEACLAVPRVLFNQALLSVDSAIKAMLKSGPLKWVILVVLESAILWLVTVFRRGLKRVINRLEARDDASFIGMAAYTVLSLLRKNLLGAGLAAALLAAVIVFQVPQPGLGIIVAVTLVWVGIKTPINLAWLLLASPQLPHEQRRPALYGQVKWTLFFGGLLGALDILAHLSRLPADVIRVFDYFFMLALLLAVAPALRIRRLLVDLLAGRYADRLWFTSLRLISMLMGLSMLAAAVIGLAGYLNMAWMVSWHLLLFTLMIVGWQIVRAIVNDLVVVLKNYAVTHSGYGLLWTQDIINPLHRIFDVVLFVTALWALSRLYNLDADSFIVTKILFILEQPLFSLGQASISLEEVFAGIIIFMIVLWSAQWIRSITYRWVFSRIHDLGIRHSMSVFAQYAIVLIGFLIILDMLGLDLTTLAVFAGALGVGIGLGMQDMAKNFISGLMLLIERPLRSGDTVQIGDKTGEVTRIGIRSLTVQTWDNMEVIIPNSDVISTAFTNWTHSDNVVRTVLMVSARFDANPHTVKKIIHEVVENHSGVLDNPEWLVLFWEFGDSAVTFRVQYFTDFFKSNILIVRDEVLCRIWDGFEKAGIGVPYPQRDLYIKEWPGDRPGTQRSDSRPGVPLLEKAPLPSAGTSSARFAKT